MPSLHAGIACLIALYGVQRLRSPWRWLLLAYPLLMGLALVYNGEHYVVDVVAGYALAAAVLVGCSAWERARAQRTGSALELGRGHGQLTLSTTGPTTVAASLRLAASSLDADERAAVVVHQHDVDLAPRRAVPGAVEDQVRVAEGVVVVEPLAHACAGVEQRGLLDRGLLGAGRVVVHADAEALARPGRPPRPRPLPPRRTRRPASPPARRPSARHRGRSPRSPACGRPASGPDSPALPQPARETAASAAATTPCRRLTAPWTSPRG